MEFAYLFDYLQIEVIECGFCVLFICIVIFVVLVTNLNLCHLVYDEVQLVQHEHENKWTSLNM
jgi:hypothetical protein